MNAKIVKLDELSHFLSDKNSLCFDLTSYFRLFGINRMVNRLVPVKSKGIPVYDLLVLLSLFRICGESIFSFYRHGFYGLGKLGKNCFYRFQNSYLMDWRRLLLCTASRFFRLLKKENSTAPEGPQAFILDDTTLEKTGSRMEFIGRVFDHTRHTHVLGYKLLSLSFFDGVSHVPLDVALQMLKRAWKHGFRPCYVVMDNWFDSHNFISGIRRMGNGMLHVICTIKKSKTRSFLVQGKKYNAASIIASRERLHARTCREYKCRYIRLDAEFSNIPVRLFFIQYGKKGEWTVLLTTDRTLNFKKAFEYYQIRWNVEVMYRECKQYLRLGKCQSNDFDAQIADATLAFMAYTMISLKKRMCEYETFGELFRTLQQECLAMTLWHRVLRQLIQVLPKISQHNSCQQAKPQEAQAGIWRGSLEDFLKQYILDIEEIAYGKTSF